MKDSEPGATIRPLLIRQVTLALLATGLLLLALALLAFGALAQGLLGRTLSFNLLCAYLLFVVAGGLGGLFHVLMARAFGRQNKIAYEWVRSTAWNPLVAVVTANGQRLDAPEVRAAFGLEQGAERKDKG